MIEKAPGTPGPQPNTYAEVLQAYPDMHPALAAVTADRAAAAGEPGFELAAVDAAEQLAGSHDWLTIDESVPISEEHAEQHQELGERVDPDIDAKPRAEQRMLGEVMELGQDALPELKSSYGVTFLEDPLEIESDIVAEPDVHTLSEVADKLDQTREAYGLARSRSDNAASDPAVDKAKENFENALYNTIAFEMADAVRAQKHEAVNLADLSRVFGAVKDALVMNDADGDRKISVNISYLLNQSVSSETLRASYFAKSDKESGSLHALISHQLEKGDGYEKTSAIRTLARIYETDCLSLRDIPDRDTDRRLQTVAKMPELVSAALGEIEYGPEAGESLEDYTYTSFNKGIEILKATGLPDRIVFNYQRAIEEKSLRKDDNGDTHQGEEFGLNASMYKTYLARTLERVDSLGADTLTRIYDGCGIINFDNYSPEQLDRMARFLDGDPELHGYLYSGDLTVVLTDANGDHNGAFGSTASTFDPANSEGRVLFFEVQKPTDIYRHMIKVNKSGLKPSTLVLGAHGAPGTMTFGSSAHGNEFKITNYDPEAIKLDREQNGSSDMWMHPLGASDGLKRLVDEYMQDIHDPDAPDEAKGRRRIILKSCSQAAQHEVERRINGVPQTVVESTAETITKQAGNSNLDVYAVSAETNMSRTPTGVKYSLDDQDYLAQKHSLDKDGTVLVEDQPEIIMRAA